MMLAPTMLRVMERREQKVRLEIARVAREIAAKRENLAALDSTIAAVERRARQNGSARFANGARTIAALLELEQNSQSLRAGREELEALRQRSQEALTTLLARQRSLSKQWRREEARLAHVTRLMQRERMLADVRQFDQDEEAFAERYSVRPIHPPQAAGVR